MNAFPTLFVTALSLAALAACNTSDAPAPTGSTTARAAQITDALGNELPVTLLPGSASAANGDAHYFVQFDERELEVSRVQLPEGAAYLDVQEAGAVLAAAELELDSMTLRAANGNFVHSTTTNLPVEAALALVEPIALALLDSETLLTFEALLAERTPGSGSIGVAQQGLRIRVGVGASTCTGSECTNSVAPFTAKCCCAVGERCVSTLNSCNCEKATAALSSVF